MRWYLTLVLLISLPSGITQADEEPSVYPPAGLQPFLGLDDTSATTRVQPGRASGLNNVSIGLTGDLRKRAGLDTIGDVLDVGGEDYCTVTGLTYAQFAGGTSRIVAICGQRVFYLNSSSVWTVVPEAPNPDITAGQNNQWVFTPALSTLIFTNDTDRPLQWAGGASDTLARVSFTGLTNAVTTARTNAFFQNYLIFGNTVEGGTRYPTRVRWSNVGTINTWTNADYNDVDAPAGQDLNCMGQLYGDLYLGFTNSLYRMSLVGGSGTFAFSKVSNEVGCAAKNSMQQVTLSNSQTGLLFLDSKKRVYFFDGIKPIEVSTFIHGTMDTLRGSRIAYSVSAADGEHYYLCTTSSTNTTNNLCLDYNYKIGEWSKASFTGLSGMNAMAAVLDSSSNGRVYVGTGDSFVYQLTSTSLDNDVGGGSGVLEAVNYFDGSSIGINFASQWLVLYDEQASFTVSGLVGAPIELVGGMASGLTGVVVANTATGIVVARDFSTTPNSTTSYLIGRINAYYTTRWDDLGDPSRIKHGLEFFAVADADLDSSIDVAYATDFGSTTATTGVSLTPSAGSLWGTATWGTSVWGGGDTVFVGSEGTKMPLNDDGRWWRFTFTEDDVDENFRLHGWAVLKRNGDLF